MKRPWNRIDLPVYSISARALPPATQAGEGAEENMNIITYCSAVSMDPKQYVVAVYKNTKTLELIKANPHFVLQLLSESQYNLIPLLGQQSGFEINKIKRLEKRKLLETWKGFAVLKDSLAWVELKGFALQGKKPSSQGDHELFLCQLVSYKNVNEGTALTTQHLREKKIVRM